MLKRLSGLLKKDIVIALRNQYFTIVVFVALLFVAVVNFVIPEDASVKPVLYYYIEDRGQIGRQLEEILRDTGDNGGKAVKVVSEQEMVERMKDNFNSIGIAAKEEGGKPVIEFVLQGHENTMIRNALVLAVKDRINGIYEQGSRIETVLLKGESGYERIPTNKSVIPLFIVGEPALLGFVLIAVMVFMEKEEGTIKAYLVSPGQLPEYLASKVLLMAIFGCISTGVVTLPTMGLGLSYLKLFLLVIPASIFFSTLGLILASFFKGISQSMVWIVALSIILTIPFISYFVPSFVPVYFRWIPTYPLLFAIREVIFPTGNENIVYSTALNFTVLGALGYLISIISYRRNLERQ